MPLIYVALIDNKYLYNDKYKISLLLFLFVCIYLDTGLKIFQEKVSVTNYTEATECSLSIENDINGMDVEELYRTVVRIVGDYEIDGLTTFEAAVKAGDDLEVFGTVNGLLIPGKVQLL